MMNRRKVSIEIRQCRGLQDYTRCGYKTDKLQIRSVCATKGVRCCYLILAEQNKAAC